MPRARGTPDDPLLSVVMPVFNEGATIDEISLPMHFDARHIWTGVILEGAAEMMLKGYAMGNNWMGYYTTSLHEAFARGWRACAGLTRSPASRGATAPTSRT